MDALITATQGRLRRSWIAGFEQLLEHNSAADIAARIEAGRPDGDILEGVRDAAMRVATGWHAGYIAAGQTAARWLDGEMRRMEKRSLVRKLLPVFDVSDPPAAHWAAQNRLDLVREIDEETRRLIKDVLMEGARAGINPLDVARDLREHLGLTEYQRQIVQNYRRELEQGLYANALKRELTSGHSDRAIAAAMAGNRSLTAKQIDTAVERYRQNWIDYRARTIARTEGLRVVHQGSDELYRQAIERGDIEPDQLEQTWHHGPPGKTGTKGERAFHRSMDGQTKTFPEPFVSGLGGLLRYPGDPEASAEETANCRCVKTTRLRPSTGAAQGGGRPGGGGGRPAGEAAVDEEIVADEAEMEAEAQAAAEEQAAAVDEAEQAALEEELAPEEPLPDDGLAPTEEPISDAELADLLGLPSEEELGAADGLLGGDRRHQNIQEAQQRLAQRRSDLDAARAEVTRLEAEHAAAVDDLAGLRIAGEGDTVGFRIAGETEADEGAWLAEQRAAAERAQRAGLPRAEGTIALPEPGEIEPGKITPSDRPAPVGFESVDYEGEAFYRHRITGRVYTPEQVAERADKTYVIQLVPPNPQLEGFDTLEVLSGRMKNPELRYRSRATGVSYAPEMMESGEAAANEEFVLHPPAKRDLSLARRIWNRLTYVKTE